MDTINIDNHIWGLRECKLLLPLKQLGKKSLIAIVQKSIFSSESICFGIPWAQLSVLYEMTVCSLMYAAALDRKLLDQSPQN